MKKSLLIVFLISVFSSFSQTTIIDSFVHDGIYRNYRVYVPAIYDGSQPVPLVLNLHGYTSNAAAQEFYGDFRPIADTANFILVHPNGTGPAGSQYWNAYTLGSPDDKGFLEALIDTLSIQYSINANRVYSCGISNGGIMSYFLACNMNNKFAAIGSVAGSMTYAMFATCVPPGNIPAIEIHGTADGTVPYNGDGSFEPIDSVIHFWTTLNACNAIPVITPYADVATGDGCTATEYGYLNGTAGAETVLVKVTGGGHTWPGAPITIGVTNHDFNASVRLWQFFRKFDKSQFNAIHENSERCRFSAIFPNPATDYVVVNGLKPVQSVSVINMMGQCMFSTTALMGDLRIDVNQFANGVYLIKAGNQTHKLIVHH
jgi:polyhydroxybutyrate depolymerase